MKAYKFVRSSFFKKGSFRLGTLWDYRAEEVHGAARGDRREGTFQIESSRPFEDGLGVLNSTNSQQDFMVAAIRGDRPNDDESTTHFISLSSPNLLIFSASLVYERRLFREFEGTNLCYEILDFEQFSRAIIREVVKHVQVNSHSISECVYTDRIVYATPQDIPSLQRMKDVKYAHQNEIRLAIEINGNDIHPLVMRCSKAKRFCKSFRKIETLTARG